VTAFLVSDEQRELVDGFLRPLDSLLPISRLHESPAGDDASWKELAELGWLAAAASEEVGGVGLGPVECALMAERLGRNLASPSIVATIMAARLLEASLPESAASLAAGEGRAAFGYFGDRKELVTVDAGNAGWAVVIGDGSIALHELGEGGVAFEDAHTLWSANLEAGRASTPIWSTYDDVEVANAQLLLAAQAVGIAAATRDAAVEYAKLREQFGQPIGAFQAIKHRCADMAMRALAASDLMSFASLALAERRDDAAFLCAGALNVALRSALLNAGASIQIHGGIGFSEECAAHHYLKRARLLEAICGRLASVRQCVLRASFGLGG
jgi:alkylation response protein AidB-like acyl-CoA dehydrogenase